MSFNLQSNNLITNNKTDDTVENTILKKIACHLGPFYDEYIYAIYQSFLHSTLSLALCHIYYTNKLFMRTKYIISKGNNHGNSSLLTGSC